MLRNILQSYSRSFGIEKQKTRIKTQVNLAFSQLNKLGFCCATSFKATPEASGLKNKKPE
ncbi:MAG: hypothetical protein C0525_04970 [Flavobacterium sp.]|nr:hypothetical protein [Flavobacterium sp.]